MIKNYSASQINVDVCSDLHLYKAVLIVPDIYNRGHLRELMNLLLLKMGFGSCFLVQVSTFVMKSLKCNIDFFLLSNWIRRIIRRRLLGPDKAMHALLTLVIKRRQFLVLKMGFHTHQLE